MVASVVIGGFLAGGMIGGAAITGSAAKNAAKTQAEAAAKALEETKRQYDLNRTDQERLYQQQRADEAPYLGLGGGAVGALQYGLGLTPPATKPTGPGPVSPGAPIPTPEGPIQRPRPGPPQGALGMFAGGPQPNSGPANGIPMRSPNGQVTRVAPDQVAHYTQLGAQVV